MKTAHSMAGTTISGSIRIVSRCGCNILSSSNLFLLRNPDKEAVKISRSFIEEEKIKKKEHWLVDSSQGTVLVSPFISKDEKAVRTEAEAAGASIILITHEAFPERFNPAEHDFNLCSSGRLLIISLGLALKTELTRPICQRMNALAEEICLPK